MAKYKGARVNMRLGNNTQFEGRGILPRPLIFSVTFVPEKGEPVTKEIFHYSGNDSRTIEGLGELIKDYIVDKTNYRGNVIVIGGDETSTHLDSLVEGLDDPRRGIIVKREASK
jgi:hypothetical protein